MSDDKIRMFVCMILQIFIGYFMNLFVVGGKTSRYIFCIVMGVFLTTYMFRETAYHIFLMAIGGYLCMTKLPRDK